MNKIQQAYEQGLRVGKKLWNQKEWIKKHSNNHSRNENGKIWENFIFDFKTHPEKWEIYEKDLPLFTPQDTIVKSVQSDLQARSERGIAKYGTTLDRTDLSEKDWLQHAYEEALDLALYLKKIINETNTPK